MQGTFVATPAIFLADAGIPMLLIAYPVMLELLLAVILIESMANQALSALHKQKGRPFGLPLSL